MRVCISVDKKRDGFTSKFRYYLFTFQLNFLKMLIGEKSAKTAVRKVHTLQQILTLFRKILDLLPDAL